MYIRSTIYFISLCSTTVIYSLGIILSSPFADYRFLSQLATQWGKLNLFLLKLICNLDYQIVGYENLPKHNGYIVIANHQSAWETISLRGLLPFDQAWILKKELLYIPFFGLALKLTRQIAINRKAGRGALKQLINDGIQSLELGRIVILFPEGTRVPIGHQVKYNIGGALLAEKSKKLIVPIAHNAGLFWPRNSFLKSPGCIKLVIGEPISISNMKASDINDFVSIWINEQVNKLTLK